MKESDKINKTEDDTLIISIEPKTTSCNTQVEADQIFPIPASLFGDEKDTLCSTQLVCKQFKVGICSLMTCPFAHPGIQDTSKEFKMKDGSNNSFVEICFKYINTKGSCKEGKLCKKYHPYIRPSTQEIIRKHYPPKNGVQCKMFENGTCLRGQVKDDILEGYRRLDCYGY